MPSKTAFKSGGDKANTSGSSNKGQKPISMASTTAAASAASTTTSAAGPATTAPSFDSLPHATSGERLRGVEVGSTIPALMSELGVLLQQTPGCGGGFPRGRNGGLMFEELDFAEAANEAAAAAFGDDVSRRLDQIPPRALECLSQVFQLQRHQTQAAAVAAAAAAASASSKDGRRSPSAEVVDSEDEGEGDGSSGSSGATGHTTPTPAGTVSANAAPGGGGAHGSEYDPYSAAGRRHNLEEMFDIMQRSIGNYARGAAAATGGGGAMDGKEKSNSGVAALAGGMGLDLAAYADPLTQLELFRAMMVATSKGRTAAGARTAGGAGIDGKADNAAELRARGQRGGGGAAGRITGNVDMQTTNPFQSFLDVLGPQLFGQARLQQRAAAGKTSAAGAASGLSKDTEAAAAAAGVSLPSARDVDVTPSSAANLSDLQKRIEQVRVLSSSTLEELAADEVPVNTSGNLRDLLFGDSEGGAVAPAALEQDLSSAKVGYCLTEAAAVAVSMLWCYLGGQQKDAPLLSGWNREAAQRHFNLLLFRVRQELAGHSPANLAEITRCFGGVVAADSESVYRAINGVGLLLFFTCKPLALLEKTCTELGISLSDSANADCNVMPELIAEKLAAFFYPMKEGKLTFAQLSFIPRVQVHEHAPGNYTCTIDNASNMGRMLRERLLSNRFSCKKVKWRAAVVNDKGELRFLVWHRYSTALSVHLLVRTSEPKKKRRSVSANVAGSAAAAAADNSNTGGEEKETSATDELRANSALFMERQVTVAPGEMIGFTDNFLDLTVALSSPTTLQHGYRTYNKADDRIVFQFSLQISNVDGTSLDGGAANTNANKCGSKQATPQHQQQQQQQQQLLGDNAEPSVSGAVACRTSGANSKEDVEAAVCALVETESAARAVIAETASLEYRHLQNDECRDAHLSRRRAEDRERKALLAKVGPPPELIREVDKLAQAVQAAQQQISKLNKEQLKDDKENEKMTEKLAQQNVDLSKLLGTLESGEAELVKLEAVTKAAERRIEEKRVSRSRKEAKKAEQNQWTVLKRVLEPTTASTHHDTLAINDLGSFLSSSSIANTAAAQLFAPSVGMSANAAVYSMRVSGGAAGSVPPLSSNSGGGLATFGTDPFSVRQATTPPSGAVNATPVFSTQPKMGITTSGSLSTNNINAGSVPGAPGLRPSIDSMGGGSSTASTHPGMVSPKVPLSPGVASNASAAMGSCGSPAPAVAAALGSPGMPLASSSINSAHNAVGDPAVGRSTASPASAMIGTGSSSGLSGGPAGGGLSFGLAPSLFSTNPVSHASHSSIVGGGGGTMGPGASASSLYTALDANAQPFSPPPPPPRSPGAASTGNHSHGGGGSSNNGGGGFAFTVTADAGVHPGLANSSSLLYQAGPTFSNGHELGSHSPPFSSTPMSAAGNGLFMMNNNGGGGGGGLHNSAGDLAHHRSLFPPQPHSPNEALSFSTSLQWLN